MTDFLSFKLLRREADCLLLKVTAGSSIITAETSVLVTDSLLEDLTGEIEAFLREQDLEGYWENDVPGMGGPTCMTLRILPRDNAGNVLLEIYMELDDGKDYASHNCCFYVHTHRNALEQFSKDILRLKNTPECTSAILSGSV